MVTTRLAALGIGCLCVLLSGCAAPPPVAVNEPPQPAGNMFTGVVISVRPVGANSLGVSNVLAALNQPMTTQQAPLSEIVIRKGDGNAVSTIQSGAAANLQPGDHVAIIAGSTTDVVKQN